MSWLPQLGNTINFFDFHVEKCVKLDGSPGDGTTQGCCEAGKLCPADGICVPGRSRILISKFQVRNNNIIY